MRVVLIMDQEKKLVFLPFLSNPVEQHRWAVTVGGKKGAENVFYERENK